MTHHFEPLALGQWTFITQRIFLDIILISYSMFGIPNESCPDQLEEMPVIPKLKAGFGDGIQY